MGNELTGILLIALLIGGAYYVFGYKPGAATLSMDFTFNYSDGSSKTYTVPTWFTTQAIIDPATNKALVSIGWRVYVKPEWTGTATKLEFTGSTALFVKVGTATPVLKEENLIGYSTTTNLVSGTTYTAQTDSVTAALLESWSPASGTKILQFQVDVAAKLTLSNSQISTKNAQANAELTYKVQPDGFTVLSVTISVTPT